MELYTVFLIVLAAIIALGVVFFQYYYRNPRKGPLKIILAALRFIALFCGLLLLINPKFVDNDYYLEKANLILMVDHSTSMKEATTERNLSEVLDKIKGNPQLQDRFSIHGFGFGNAVAQTDSIVFNQRNTDISNALSTTNELFLNGANAVVLITDGNQTLGRDYEYLNLGGNLSVNPVVVGDTTQYEDISVGLINTNTYAFLKNKFPVETTIRYQGSAAVSKTVTISINGNRVHQQRVELDALKNSQTLNTLVEAQSVGIKTIKVEVGTLENEKNTTNNVKEAAIEVIDEKTNVVIVSDMLHPDIGALKKSIEANEQRSVSITKPTGTAQELEEADILILYQPNRNFRQLYELLQNSKANYFTITGSKTDWNFLNGAQQSFSVENSQSEEILPILNNAFGVFGLGDFNVDDFPPLVGNLGDIELKKSGETIMYQQIRGVHLDKPLFSILTEGKQREAVLFGENMWRWRAQTYRNDQSFQKFDDFMGTLMVYLTSNDQRSRLDVDYALVFENASMAKIRASYFDEGYQFDPNARISIQIVGTDNGFNRESPMLLKSTYYEVDLGDLASGEYRFTVSVEGENHKRSGSFRILDFDPEKQLTSADHKKLGRLAEKTNGKLYYTDNVEALVSDLSSSEQYLPVQKSRKNVVSLIDFRILLGLMVLVLAVEWFIRKYNGLM
ncbi:VWA domain-containing protein [Flagellimonas hadalis]|uniref:VWA domain-containing protein n=1 Tax=Flagellimonas hadalis TaxID=2597517 RepID=A0A5N5J021_9FLAO|nr:VWA domain-containing protein [Allomuricauda hadalis]KAB5491686.1 VWA domain-containing protein [Allomuricauda hadalis]